MIYKLLTVIIIAAVLAACGTSPEQGDLTLTPKDSLNLKLVKKENVASFSGPPMIPVDHPFAFDEDIYRYQTGGEACLDCHNNADEAEDIPQTQHPERHYCTQCHIVKAEETATAEDFHVENSFSKVDPSAK